ncbi:MAG: carboxypeptidase-like regulatory domain-containing protein, partial [Tannerellaceae bacterium]|nr:carboxypeptidase-like regulatory domain-containing protein [Tannerellaceae bacterium]
MKRFGCILLFIVFTGYVSAQNTIRGIVVDESSQPLPYANVFIKETLEGTSSNEGGNFSFTSSASGAVTLSVMMLGYETYNQALQLPASSSLTIRMRQINVSLGDVEIVASSYQLSGSSQWEKMNAVDLVTTGGSVGDLYKSIATLPGSQVNAESGKLFIRGGESRETQTYIDGMHVLNPYTTTSENEPVRGRYSPFMFEGMAFSLGGYDPEYSQGLSGVLLLNTKDESPVSKYGVNVSSVGGGGGGTKALAAGSASINLDYQNLG